MGRSDSVSRLTVSATIGLAIFLVVVVVVVLPNMTEAAITKELRDFSTDKNCELMVNCNKPLFTKNAVVFGSGYCQDQKRQHNCAHYYAQKCLSSDMWPEHFLQYNISVKTVEDLCSNNGIYKHDYNRHHNCINSVQPENNECETLLPNMTLENEIAKSNHEQCESHKMYIQCVHTIVKTNCGAEIAMFARHILNRLGSLLLNYCGKIQEKGHVNNVTMSSSTTPSPTETYQDVEESTHSNTLFYILLGTGIIIIAMLGITYAIMTGKCRFPDLRELDYMKIVIFNARTSETTLP